MSRSRPSFSSRRSSSSRRSRQNSVTSFDSKFLEDNNHEMFSGAPSEVIPSSISSFHYAHHFNTQSESDINDTSPLLVPTKSAAHTETDLYSMNSNATNISTETSNAHFRFFTADQIEAAPGGSTLENPEDPIDYNTNWDYNVDKYEDEDETGLFKAPEASPAFIRSSSHSRRYSAVRSPRSPHTRLLESDVEDEDLDQRSYFDDRYRRRSSTSTYRSRSSSEISSSAFIDEENAFTGEYRPVTAYQRYYLAEEDIVVGIAGYFNCWWKTLLYYCITVFTFGLGYLVLRWMPKLRINLMGSSCPLGKASWCVIENEYGELTFVDVSRSRFDERLSSFLTVKVPENDKAVSSEKQADPVVPYLHYFEYRYLKFFYNPVEDIFKTNSAWYDTHWLNVKNLREGTSQALQEQRQLIFGANNIQIQEKSNIQLLADEVLHPFYVFQVFSIFLWLADDYYYYASCIFVISLVSIVNTLVETKATIRRLSEMSLYSCDVRVWRNGFWTSADSNTLVPGDVFEVDPSLSVVPCDALLVNGEIVVNESMLTGESVPVTKFSATSDAVSFLTENLTHPSLARSLLYNGTKLLKMKSTNDEPAMAMVLKTGFNTTKGSLVRSMLFPKPVGFKFYEDSFKYIGFMTMIAFIGFIYSTYNFIQLGLSTRIMILRALDIITIVVPPALPATLTIGTSFAVSRLKQKQIFCIAPTRVNIGGKLDVACFDKTGTLTEDGLDVLGVHPTKNAEGRKEIIFDDLVSDISGLSIAQNSEYSIFSGTNLLGIMASCHSLRLIDDSLLGDPLDVKMFEFTGWHFTEDFGGNSVPLVYDNVGKETFGYKILKEYEFVSSLRRMSVLVEKDDNKHVFTKGAPEVMLDICDPTTLPSNYEELLYKYTHGGYRVIACATKQLKNGYRVERSSLGREEAENDLEFAGFIIFENKLKSSTKGTLKELREAEIRSIMCTGDNVLTAVSVGRECELIGHSVTQVYIPRFANEEEMASSGETGLIWEEMNNPENKLDPVTLERHCKDIRDDVHDYILAVTGDIFRYILVELQREDLRDIMLMKCNIFARMSPDEKHELVEQLQNLDYTVGFCGDGANDCGALKAADVGISLSEAEASVAAPFTSRIFEISCVLDVIKEGRSSLVTSFSCFKYMSLYSAIQFVTVSLLYKRGTNLGDFQFLYIDMCLILPLAIFMSWSKPYNKLATKRPTANLVSPKILIPLICQIVTILVFQIFVWAYVQSKPWYIKPVPSDDDANVKSTDNTVLFLYTNMQYVLNAVVLSTGPPYREPMQKNRLFLANLVVSLGISVLLFRIEEDSWWGNFMQLTNMPRSAYTVISIVAVVNFVVSYQGEKNWFKSVARLYKSFTNKSRTSKKKFKNLKQGVRRYA